MIVAAVAAVAGSPAPKLSRLLSATVDGCGSYNSGLSSMLNVSSGEGTNKLLALRVSHMRICVWRRVQIYAEDQQTFIEWIYNHSNKLRIVEANNKTMPYNHAQSPYKNTVFCMTYIHYLHIHYFPSQLVRAQVLLLSATSL